MKSDKGFVYIIQEGYDNFFKIGSTKNEVEFRKQELQVGNSTELRVFGKIESSEYEKLENELHEKFNAGHERGEWFYVDPKALVDMIDELGGELCVDDPFRIKMPFDKEAFRADIEKELKDRMLANHQNEMSRLKNEYESKLSELVKSYNFANRVFRKFFKFSKIGFSTCLVLGVGWLIFAGVKAIDDKSRADSEKFLIADSTRRANEHKADSLRLADARNATLKAATDYDEAVDYLDSLKSEPIKNAADIFDMQTRVLPELWISCKLYDDLESLAHNSISRDKDSTEIIFETYENLLSDSANCAKLVRVYSTFKKNAPRDYALMNCADRLLVIEERLRRVKREIKKMDTKYPKFWLKTHWHKF